MRGKHESLSLPDLSGQINSAAEEAYQKIASERGLDATDIPFQEGYCTEVTDAIIQNLEESGHTAWRTNRLVWLNRPWGVDGKRIPLRSHESAGPKIGHSYGWMDVVNGAVKNRLVFDANWQQFLPRERTVLGLPKVLIGTHEEVAKQAQAFGIASRGLLEIWAARRSVI